MPMLDFVLIIPLAAGAFFATNFDNLVLLVAMLAREAQERRHVLAGYAVSVVAVLGLSYVIAKSADLVPVGYLGLLGVVPLAMGIRGLVTLRRGKGHLLRSASAPDVRRAITGEVALTLLGNSADTLLVLSALLADSAASADPLIIASCLASATLLAGGACYAVGHPRFERAIGRIAPILAPAILVVVGIYIIVNSATDLVPG